MKKIRKARFEKKKSLALANILILLIGIIGFSYVLGSEVGFVSGRAVPVGIERDIGVSYTPVERSLEMRQSGFGRYGLPIPSDYSRFDSALAGHFRTGGASFEDIQKYTKWSDETMARMGFVKGKTLPEILAKKGTSEFLEWTNEMGWTTRDYEAMGINSGNIHEVFPGLTPEEIALIPGKWKEERLFYNYEWSQLWKGVTWAAGVYAIMETLKGPLQEAGLNPGIADSLQSALTVGMFSYQVSKGFQSISGLKAGFIGLGVAAGYFLLTYHQESYRVVTFECLPWQPSIKPNEQKCGECGKDGLPCSEYQCRSLGQSCKLLNDENTGEAVCVEIKKIDVSPPVIEVWREALSEGYSYSPLNVRFPQDRGVTISPEDGDSIPPFTRLSFGIRTIDSEGNPDPSRCKIDVVRKDSFEEMAFFMSNGIYKYNHSYILTVPSLEAAEEEGITLLHGKEQEIYIRCMDANGNYNVGTFVFKFTIDEEEDATPPMIVGTSIKKGAPIASEVNEMDVSIYVNKPVNGCMWDYINRDYSAMSNEMDCSNARDFSDMNSQGLFTCIANLKGIKSDIENNFYFRCENKNGFKMMESYEFSLRGTRPLVISSASPNMTTIKDSTTSIRVEFEVETGFGADRGSSICYYKESTEPYSSYVQFLETGKHNHKNSLWLTQGDYIYDIRCVDEGGNSDVTSLMFSVESDNLPPIITRAYHEENYLKIITDEEAECVYDFVDCSYLFSDGIRLTTINDILHYTSWDTDSTFYIKCKDQFGNMPLPNECSTIIRPFDF